MDDKIVFVAAVIDPFKQGVGFALAKTYTVKTDDVFSDLIAQLDSLSELDERCACAH